MKSIEIIGVELGRTSVTNVGQMNGNNIYNTTQIEIITKQSNYKKYFNEVQISIGHDTGEKSKLQFTNNSDLE